MNGDAGAYQYVRVVDPMAERISEPNEWAAGDMDSILIRKCSRLTQLLGAIEGNSQGVRAAWSELAGEIILMFATTESGIIAKYNALQAFPNPPTAPEMEQAVSAFDTSLDRDLRRAKKDWGWLRLSPQRRRHQQIWDCWESNRKNDHEWLPLTILADFWTRKHYGEANLTETEAWRRIRNSILIGEFFIGDKNKVFLVCPGDICWRLTPKFLQERPPFPEKEQPDPIGEVEYLIDGYLKCCWVPNDLAVQWLGTYRMTLPYNLLPSSAQSALPVRSLAKPPIAQMSGNSSEPSVTVASLPDLSAPTPKKRKSNGLDYRENDALLFLEMRTMINDGRARSPEDAARAMEGRIKGGGKSDSKVKRVAKRYRETQLNQF